MNDLVDHVQEGGREEAGMINIKTTQRVLAVGKIEGQMRDVIWKCAGNGGG